MKLRRQHINDSVGNFVEGVVPAPSTSNGSPDTTSIAILLIEGDWPGQTDHTADDSQS